MRVLAIIPFVRFPSQNFAGDDQTKALPVIIHKNQAKC